MKNSLLGLVLIVIFASCNSTTGSGNIISENRQVSNFTGVNVGGGFEVEIKQGATTSVTVEADDNLIKHVSTTVSGSTLRIKLSENNVSDAHLKVIITAPVIGDIHASAGADVTAREGLKDAAEIKLNASSGAKINTIVDAPSVDIQCSSAGEIVVEGRTRTLNLETSSGASVRAGKLLSEKTVASASSGGSAHVYSSISLKANASSGGTIDYSGGGSTQVNASSGGSVNKEE